MSVNTCSQSMSGLRSPAFSNVPSGHGALYRKLHTCNAGAWGARRRLSQLSAGTPKLLLTAGKHTRVALKTQVRKFSESVGKLVEIHLCEHLRMLNFSKLGYSSFARLPIVELCALVGGLLAGRTADYGSE